MAAIIQNLPQVSRKSRRPKHSFQVSCQPFVIQPTMIAPVLPGETLENFNLQARVVTDPIQNPLIGWWHEHYVFYVKHRDLDARDLLTSLMITPGTSLSSIHGDANTATYHPGTNTVDWMELALKRVVEEYFRDQGEAWTVSGLIDGLPLAAAETPGWMDSIIDTTLLPDGGDIPDTGASGEEINTLLDNYEFLRRMKLTQMTYEDFLKTYGVRGVEADEPHKPELLRYVRDWTYPTNTVNPTDGVPASACSWSIAERGDKARFFKEPGFIFAVTVTRPKVYYANQNQPLANYMDTAFAWLPAIMSDQPETSLREFAAGATAGPITGTTNGYWLDLRDLLLYGDQFVNFAMSATGDNSVALPTAALQKKFVSQADINSFFKTSGTNKVRMDGVYSLNIMGTQMDHT